MIFIHVGALFHETIRNNRGGITAAVRSSGMDRADRIDSNAGTLRLDLSSSPLSVRSTRREGVEAPFIFPFSFFWGGTPPSISDNRPSPAARGKGASQGFRIEFRTPRRALPMPDFFYGTPGCVFSWKPSRGAWAK